MPAEIAAITFIEAAASELSQRVEEFVTDVRRGTTPIQLHLVWSNGPTEAQRESLSSAAAELDAVACTTIHGFCRQLLTPYPVEARIDPGAAIADQNAAALDNLAMAAVERKSMLAFYIKLDIQVQEALRLPTH